MTLVLLLVLGALIGAIGALLGVGGGFILVPILILYFGLDVRQAVAAGLAAVIATSSAAGSSNLGKGIVNLRLALVLETATVAGALCGGMAAAWLPERLTLALFAGALTILSASMWRGPSASEPPGPSAPPPQGAFMESYFDPALGREIRYAIQRVPTALAASLAAGGLSSLLGIGGGVVKVPILHLACGMPMKAAAATSNFMIGVTASAGALIYLVRGDMRVETAGAVALGALAGSKLGVSLSRKASDRGLRRAFAILALFLAVRMFLKLS